MGLIRSHNKVYDGVGYGSAGLRDLTKVDALQAAVCVTNSTGIFEPKVQDNSVWGIRIEIFYCAPQ